MGSNTTASRNFTLVLLAATVLPFVLLGLVFSAAGYSAGTMATLGSSTLSLPVTILFLGNAHVYTSLFYYLDRDYRPLLERHRVRYLIAAPAAIAVFALAPLVLSPPWIVLIFFTLQLWHFGKQNVGLYSFVSAGAGLPATPVEKAILRAVAVIGVLAFYQVATDDSFVFRAHVLVLHTAALYALLALLAGTVIWMALNRQRFTPLKAILLVVLCLFFSTLFLSSNPIAAAATFATAHGLQYIVFMTVLAGNKPTGPDGLNPALGAVFGLVAMMLIGGGIVLSQWEIGGALAEATGFQAALPMVLSAMLGLTVAHFIVDAKAWRLSDPAHRAYVGKPFAFLFKPQDVSNVSAPVK